VTGLDDPAFATIAELGAALRAGTVSVEELARLSLDRNERHGPTLNAFIHVAAEAALRQAKELDRELRSGRERGPLHGIPVGIKDIIDVAGQPTSYGSGGPDPAVAARDAALVARLRAAGAVLLGKTHTWEFAYAAFHPRHGYARNPWDPTRTAGATSGGSASAVAAGLVAAAVGTDAGGSVRIPAAFCGIVGFKPTFGAVDLEGAFPSSWSLDHAGAMGRSVACAATLLAAMTDPPIRPREIPSLRGLRFGLVSELADHACVAAGVRAALAATCDRIRGEGGAVEPVSLPLVLGANEAMMDILCPEIWAIHERRLATHRAFYDPASVAAMEPGRRHPAVRYVKARRFQDELAHAIAGALAERRLDALLCPTAPWPAQAGLFAANDEAMLLEGIATAPFSVAGAPAVSVFMGLAEEALPAGLQIVGPRGGDAPILGIAALVERLAPAPRPRGFAS
jgi:aspartyl-tRNA(Asn)/glutamyl-tRNA(Gln) amidotransferase subunit A